MSADTCVTCRRVVGRAGRTNAQVLEAIRRGEFMSMIEAWDYSIDPPTVTAYCLPCWRARPRDTPNWVGLSSFLHQPPSI